MRHLLVTSFFSKQNFCVARQTKLFVSLRCCDNETILLALFSRTMNIMNSLYTGFALLYLLSAPVCHAFLNVPFSTASFRTSRRFLSMERTALKAHKTTTFSAAKWKIPLMAVLLSVQFASPSQAVDSIFNHEYSDPLHPLCNRRIEVLDDGKSFHYTGTAVGPKDDPVLRGCSKEEIRKYKFRRGEFYGEILPGNKVSAGDGIHEGVSSIAFS